MRRSGENTTSRLRYSMVKQKATWQRVWNPHTGAITCFLKEIQSVKSPGWSMNKGDEERVTLRNSPILTIIPYLPFTVGLLMWGEGGSAAGK